MVNWRSRLIRAVGATNPFTAPLVQLQSDLDVMKIENRLGELEDPISHLHPDVVELSEMIYEELKASGHQKVDLKEDQYEAYRRPLALLEGEGLITASHAIGNRHAHGLRPSTSYLLYMAVLFDEGDRMAQLIDRVESAEPGQWLRGNEVAQSVGVPVPVVGAVFNAFESRGLGLLSEEVGTTNYLPQA